ncbi:MAG: hypothetical protein EOP54_30805, partial [Sphingobacteriales bacterium]
MKNEDKFNLFKQVRDIIKDDTSAGMPPVPDTVADFLGKLSMLEGVPVQNLVPNINYLPLGYDAVDKTEIGAFKLFYLDPEWVQSLLCGALSLADEQSTLLLRGAMDGTYAAKVHYNDTKEKIIRQIAGLYEPAAFDAELKRRIEEKHLEYGNPEAVTNSQSNWSFTGFFIRSSIIKQWRGVQVIASGFDDDNQHRPRRVVRLMNLSADTMFCLCEGVIKDTSLDLDNLTGDMYDTFKGLGSYLEKSVDAPAQDN